MTKELREKILAFNRKAKEKSDKAADMDILVAAILELPPGQLKKVLSEDVLAVLAKYGYGEGG
ncbi:MAG: hypothetical protein J6K89_05295 [Oscillospiraceae bacterium]|nr:hypothetical protein [Oscillospiraceae bacterium]